MGIVGSVLGATLGWWMLGPLGVIMGIVLGHLAEDKTSFVKDRDGLTGRSSRSGFMASLLVLIAAVMKADGKVVRAELDFVKRSLIHTFGKDQTQQALLMLRDILKQSIPIREVVHQIRVNMDYYSRLELLHLMYGIALADQYLSSEELGLIHSISGGLGISESDFLSIRSMFQDDLAAAYKVLEIDEVVLDDQVKRAYRRMALRYHPDKVAQLGDDVKRSAEEKFRKVNSAYERIKKARGMN
ncbi:MAG: TerB family tellurite resistance protein [Marinilabiliaceae bacterium]|nr:TerB family tellurite resistance protein [Marinilabiliaceae bacterium]